MKIGFQNENETKELFTFNVFFCFRYNNEI